MAEDTHSLKVRSFVPDTWNVRLWDKQSVQAFLRDTCGGWGRLVLLLLRLDLVPAPGIDVTA